MWKMRNPRMDYAWGSTTAIPEFLGEERVGGPVAEVWIGAHPKAPSVLVGFEGADVALDEVLGAHPELLGDAVRERFGGLPYLVKLLAAGGPLSIQVHPSEATAREGFAREEAEGLPLDAPTRTYKDPHHKPETMIALAPTETLAGFRSADDASRLLAALELPWADAVADLLDDANQAPALAALLDGDAWVAARESVLARCAALAGPAAPPVEPAADPLVEPAGSALREGGVETSGTRPYSLALELDAAFPGDPGTAAPFLLNIATYDVGQALFVPTGEIHAHVRGFGIEVMAASDNVIRAGLTPKFVDAEALFGSLSPTANPPHLFTTDRTMRFPVSEFAVARLSDGDAVDGAGPRIVLAHDGPCTLSLDGDLTLQQGETAFVADGETPVIRSGAATVVFAG